MITMVSAIVAILNTRKIAKNKNSTDFETAIESSASYGKHYSRLSVFIKTNPKKEDWINLAHSIDNDVTSSAHILLNWWERAANGIKNDVYSENTLYDVYRGEVLHIIGSLIFFIEEVRKKQSNPRIFIGAEWLHKKWKRKKYHEEHDLTIKNLFVISAITIIGVYIAWEMVTIFY